MGKFSNKQNLADTSYVHKNPFPASKIDDKTYQSLRSQGLTDEQIGDQLYGRDTATNPHGTYADEHGGILGHETKMTPEELVQKIIDEKNATRDKASAVVDQVYGTQYGNMGQARDQADFDEWLATQGLAQYAQSPEMAAITPSEYVGDVVSQAATAEVDPRARAAQYDALDKLKGYTGEGLTPEEKYMMATARMQEERDQRAAREAALRDLSARGQRSGAAQMAATLGGQRITSQNRMLGDLAAQANAQRRAIAASEAYGNQANTLGAQTFDESFRRGSAADAVAQSNQAEHDRFNQETDRFKLTQQGERWGRQTDVTGALVGAAKDKFGRQGDVTGVAERGAALKVGAITGTDPSEAYKIALGHDDATKASKLIGQEDDSFNLFNPGTWF